MSHKRGMGSKVGSGRAQEETGETRGEVALTGHRCTSQYAFSWRSSAYLSALFLSFPALKSQNPR